MTGRSAWEEFFDDHAPDYMTNPFTKNTVAEVGFLLEELELRPGSRILDVGCGTGRHAIELAKRGYQVTGVDISKGMLAQAASAAQEADVLVEWIHADATRFKASSRYDAAICLCEGAFGLLSLNGDPIKHDYAILDNIHAALSPGAGFILTALNGLRLVRQFTQEDVESGRFDPATMTETSTMSWESPKGRHEVIVRERGYAPTELVMLFRWVGFEVKNIWGGTAGNWGRRKIDLDEMEVMIVAERTAGTEN